MDNKEKKDAENNSYINLAAAVIKLAMDQYKKALIKIAYGKKSITLDNVKFRPIDLKKGIETFFNSEWFMILSLGTIDPKTLINQLTAEAQQIIEKKVNAKRKVHLHNERQKT